jgi:hypothetical protein
MGEITRDSNQRYEGILRRLSRQFLSDEVEDCVIFLGAGASYDPVGPSPPTAAELSRSMAKECGLEWHEYIPLSTIAYYYEFFRDRQELNYFLSGCIGNPQLKPSRTIRELMRIIRALELRDREVLVITTNYDQLFERAYKEEFKKPPIVVTYNGGTDANDLSATLNVVLDRDPRSWRPRGKTFLYKMHGCISRTKEQKESGVPEREHNLVVTEEDYINFLSNALSTDLRKGLLPYVLGKVAEASILFIGYSLADWNFRVIFKATAERHGKKNIAVQYFDPKTARNNDQVRWQALVEFWQKKSVDIINVDAANFVSDLANVMSPREDAPATNTEPVATP